jgi:hypothetical protein
VGAGREKEGEKEEERERQKEREREREKLRGLPACVERSACQEGSYLYSMEEP